MTLENDILDSRPYRPCAGIMLFNKEGLIFTGKRIDNIADAWQMPQGGIDEGEDADIAIMRELLEETGTNKAELVHKMEDWLYYDLPQDLSKTIWGGEYKGQMQKWYLMFFTGNDSDINIQTHIPEFCEWKWAEIDHLPHLIIDFKRPLYERLVNYFKPKMLSYLSLI